MQENLFTPRVREDDLPGTMAGILKMWHALDPEPKSISPYKSHKGNVSGMYTIQGATGRYQQVSNSIECATDVFVALERRIRGLGFTWGIVLTEKGLYKAHVGRRSDLFSHASRPSMLLALFCAYVKYLRTMNLADEAGDE